MRIERRTPNPDPSHQASNHALCLFGRSVVGCNRKRNCFVVETKVALLPAAETGRYKASALWLDVSNVEVKFRLG
jgi:hypothetical protein